MIRVSGILGITMLYGCTLVFPPQDLNVNYRFESEGSGTTNHLKFPSILTNATEYAFYVFSDFHQEDYTNPFIPWLDNHIGTDPDGSADFLVHCGDQTNYGQLSEYNKVIADFLTIPLPLYWSLGNHDIYGGGWENFSTLFGSATYAFRAGNGLFIVLDSASGSLGKKQLTWLKAQLEAKTEEHCFIFQHYPTWYGPDTDLDRTASYEETYYKIKLYDIYNVTVEFTGHNHYFQHFNFDDVDYYSLCSVRYNQGDKCIIRVSIQGSQVSYKVVSVDTTNY